MSDTRTGAERIVDERRRQIEELGYDADHDELIGVNELATAAIAYAMYHADDAPEARDYWPWDPVAFKPTGDVVRDLTKAGALIAAAIDAELAAR